MRSVRPRVSRFSAIALSLILATGAFAKNDVGKPNGGGAAIEWQVSVTGHQSVRLTVVGPDGESLVRDFRAGQNPSISVKDLGADAIEGQYNYELRVEPKVAPGVKKQLEAARANNDEATIRKVMKEAGLGNAIVQSGTITLLNNSFVSPSATEADANDTTSSATAQGRGVSSNGIGSVPAPGRGITVNDQVIPDDLIVTGSECIGFDCVDGESFGVDTLKLKENNLRIYFEDTSSSSGFATNDWRIIANEQPSGGANMFAIEDSTAARNPMTIEAAAPANALYVDSTGNIGLQTATPALDLHLSMTDTPAVRLEQTNGGGFTAQTWDIGANEANFFIRDLTGGSKLSFRIRPGAPTSSIDIAATGAIGFGTASPVQRFHFFENTDNQTLLQVQNPNTGVNANGTFRAMSDATTIDIKSHSSTRNTTRWGRSMAGWGELLAVASNGLAIGTQTAAPLVLGTNSTTIMEIGSAGGVTITGNLTVTGNKNFAVVDPGDAGNALYYTALEGPEAGTYFRGSAKTVNGEIVIDLPGYFSRITESEKMTVQLTPVGAPGQIYVAEKSPSRLVIKVAEGTNDLEFDYLVQGVRKGYLDYEVERKGAFPVSQQ